MPSFNSRYENSIIPHSQILTLCDRVTRPIISVILINQEKQYFFIILLLIFLRLGISQLDLASLRIA